MTPEGFYVHIPFCIAKCSYCDFNSVPIGNADPRRYLAALGRDIAALPPDFAPRTIYIGGGTPTALSAARLGDLMGQIERHVDASGVVEFSVEANPATVTEEKLDLLLAHGAGRLSIGAQSFDDKELKTIGRIHRAGETGETLRLARRAGFDNVGLDLIWALPGQTLESWAETLEAAMELEPEHVSAYCLTYEEGTPLSLARDRGGIRPADEDLELDMLRTTVDLLAAGGWVRYEISNWARPGRECLHNVSCWKGRQTYGVGAGAVSFVNGRRCRNCADPAAYADAIESGKNPVEFEESLEPAAAFRESVVIGLRMCAGVDLGEVEKATGVARADVYDGELEALRESGLLVGEGGLIRLTDRGMELADEVMVRLV